MKISVLPSGVLLSIDSVQSMNTKNNVKCWGLPDHFKYAKSLDVLCDTL